MDPLNGTNKAARSSSFMDFISTMPDDVVTNIMDRLPIQEAVRTGILAKKWRFKWTLLSELVFDKNFFQYLLRTKNVNFMGRNISKILLRLKGDVTKFVLYIPDACEYYFILRVEDINNWITFLCEKKIEEFTLINMLETSLKLPTNLLSCLELRRLELLNCCLFPPLYFDGFPELLILDFKRVRFLRSSLQELIDWSPLLEILRIDHHDWKIKMHPMAIAKLDHLKTLSLALCKIHKRAITSSDFLEFLDYIPTLEDLTLDFQKCKVVEEAGTRKKIIVENFVKKLTLWKLDFNNRTMVLFAVNLIRECPYLQTLRIVGRNEDRISPPVLSSFEIEFAAMGKLQLQIVELECIKDSEIEVYLIKYLLAYSPLLKKMVINHISGVCESCDGNYVFAMKLLKLYRASPTAKIDLNRGSPFVSI